MVKTRSITMLGLWLVLLVPAVRAAPADGVPRNGMYLTMRGLLLGPLGFTSGGFDYARRTMDIGVLRVGLGFSEVDALATDNPGLSANAEVDYLVRLVRGPVEPYVGLGITFSYRGLVRPPAFGSYGGSLPFGVEIPLTPFLSVGFEGAFTVTTSFDGSWTPSGLALGFASPALLLSVWF
jgi:hypothetical protein